MSASAKTSQKCVSAEDYWNFVKRILLEPTVRRSGWTKGPARHRETWWRNDDVDNSFSEKFILWKKWKERNISKEKYLQYLINYWDQVNSWKKLLKFWDGLLCKYKSGPFPLLLVGIYWNCSNGEACAKKLSQVLENNIDDGGIGFGLRIYMRYCLKK